ncbi:NYN domain-containing protein [Geomesophilobacter sediminis]|uniref:NYN domain-containing protein n=1 Tax=Geomesophilobacter sediminis TaxID=2798584 RepID=A0A8J7M0C7_9BACT|nr:NYN domain-containing protein [Geomesophilobacter sediminis]MBJ6724497.1 NYN domain-containing protein [Geomesophilobacter sediminis]
MSDATMIRSALFVDFDNIYLNFNNQDQDLAKAFATRPERWLRWLVESKPNVVVGGAVERRILIRRCYLNPSSFADFRPYFTKSAFEVIDCPPLTSRGKTSTDVHMVMDILETLHHYPSIDEFIILSGDADFTPVLIKLRKHDRRTSVLAAGYASPAYKASGDHVFDLDEFITAGIGFVELETEQQPLGSPATEANSPSIVQRIGARVHEVVQESGPVQAADLPRIFREFKEFGRDTNWLGFGTLRRLAVELVHASPKLVLIDDDPWKIGCAAPEVESAGAEPAETAEPGLDADTKQRMEEFIIETVRSSSVPVVLAKMAYLLGMKFGSRVSESQWYGSGSFKALLAHLNLPGVEISTLSSGFLFDRTIHEAPEEKMDSLQVKIHNITDTPLLPPEHYQILFRCLANEVNANGYSLNRTSKAVRDCCAEEGAAVARSHVNFVLLGLGHMRYRFQQGQEEAPLLAQKFYENVLNLCRSSQIFLSDEETASVRAWITGKP